MNYIAMKQYIKECINSKEAHKKRISNEIETDVDKEITLESEEIRTLKRAILSRRKIKFLPIFKKEIGQEWQVQRMTNLRMAQKQVEEEILELKAAFKILTESGFKEKLYPNKTTLQTILSFCVENQVPHEEALECLLALCNLNHFSKKMQRTPEKIVQANLEVMFHSDLTCNSDINLDSILFTVQKFFQLNNLAQDSIRKQKYLDRLIEIIKYSYKKQTVLEKLSEKAILESQKNALKELYQYTDGLTIYKSCSEEELSRYLTILEFDEEQKEALLKKNETV